MPNARLSALALLACGAFAALPGGAAWAQDAGVAAPAIPVTYADLAGLSEAAGLVVRAEIREQAVVAPERAPGLPPGKVRLYLEARTQALIGGRTAIGESLRFLVDLPLEANGKPPKLRKRQLILFANQVPGRPGELQLVAPDAVLPYDLGTEARLRAILAELYAPGAPPRIAGIREAMSVRGNLAGESETQLFLESATGDPVALSVLRRPGEPPHWGVSWSEIVDQSAKAPDRGTLPWYRLACSLPREIPRPAYLQEDPAARAQAAADYRVVLEALGPCERTR